MWHELFFTDEIEQKLRGVVQSGGYNIDESTGIFMPATTGGYDTNWLFTGMTDQRRDCFFYHSTLFRHFNFVPSTCRFQCWKVVVSLRNFKDCFRWWGVMQAMPFFYGFMCPLHGKTGMDVRYYTGTPWASFFYNDSKEEGLRTYEYVKQAVMDHMEKPEEIKVVLKRGCTEFEREKGDSNGEFWNKMTPDEIDFETHMRDIFAPLRIYTVQPDWVKNKTVWRWTKWAMSHGDRTPIEVFGKDLWSMAPVTYHKEGGEFNPNVGNTSETFHP